MIQRLRPFLVLLILCSLGSAAGAQSYPSQTITIVASATPGGVTDVIARVLAKRLHRAFVVDGNDLRA